MANYRVLDDDNNEITQLYIPRNCVAGSELSGRRILGVDSGAFKDCVNLVSVEFEDACQIGVIGTYEDNGGAFENCSSITTVILNADDSVETKNYVIDGGAFKNCSALNSINTTNLHLSDVNSGIQIGTDAFNGTGFTNFNLDYVNTLGSKSLANCSLLERVTTDAYYVSSEVFKDDSNLTSITFKNADLYEIGSKIFKGCSSLSSITFYGTVAQWQAIQKQNGWEEELADIPSEWEDEIYLVNCYDGDTPLVPAKAPGAYDTENDTYTSWEDLVSQDKVKLTNDGTNIYKVQNMTQDLLVVPNTVTSISEMAFNSCDNFKEIKLPNTIDTIGRYAFRACHNLEKINIPTALSTLPERMFEDCYKLNNITIPANVTTISNYAFNNCQALSYMKYLGTVAQYDLISVGSMITLKAPVIFIECSDGERLVKETGFWYNNDNSYYKSIQQAISDYNIYNQNGVLRLGSLSVQVYMIADNTFHMVNNYGFQNDTHICGFVVDPKTTNMTYIGNSAFYGCSNLTRYYCKTATYIGNDAFSGCNLSKVKIFSKNEHSTTIGGRAFAYNLNLNKVEFDNESGGSYTFYQSISNNNNTFYRCDSLTEIELPRYSLLGGGMFISSGVKNIYVNSLSQQFKSIDGVLYTYDGEYLVDYPKIKDNLSYRIETGTKYLGYNSGAISDIGPAFKGITTLQELTIPDSVIYITGFGAAPTLSTLNYEGTMSEWNNITKQNTWNSGISATVVHCSDGDITL